MYFSVVLILIESQHYVNTFIQPTQGIGAVSLIRVFEIQNIEQWKLGLQSTSLASVLGLTFFFAGSPSKATHHTADLW